jgi:hypothetical protein
VSDEDTSTNADAEGAGETETEDRDWKSDFEAQKKVNRDLERKTKGDLKRISDLESQLAKIREGSAPKDEVAAALDKARQEARAEAQQEIARDRVFDKIEAKAGGKFADAADAAALLLREGDVEDFLDGTRVDSDAIAAALDDLLKRKPYLAAGKSATERKAPKPDHSQGNRGGKPLSGREAALAEAQKRFGKTPAAT